MKQQKKTEIEIALPDITGRDATPKDVLDVLLVMADIQRELRNHGTTIFSNSIGKTWRKLRQLCWNRKIFTTAKGKIVVNNKKVLSIYQKKLLLELIAKVKAYYDLE